MQNSRGAKIGPVFKLETVTGFKISRTNYARAEYISECAQIRTFIYQEMCLSDIATALVTQLLTLSWRRLSPKFEGHKLNIFTEVHGVLIQLIHIPSTKKTRT